MDFSENLNKKLKIGIIGAGISGCSSAYFLKDLFGDKVEIVLFEKCNQIGGRLSTYEYENRQYEIGGSILHPSNLYMEKFLEIFNLEKNERPNKSSIFVGFYNADQIVFSTTSKLFGLLNQINFFKHFGLIQLIKFTRWINLYINDFKKIYKLQDHGYTFLTIEQFLKKLNPRLYQISQNSLRDALTKMKFNDRIINELASVACLSNYGQSVNIDGLVGAVSLAGITGELWSVKNGNKQMPIKLVEKLDIKILLNTQVKLISKDSEQPESKNVIVYKTNDDCEMIDNNFDYVLISFPLHNNDPSRLQLNLDTDHDFSNLKMQLTNTYIIRGQVKLFDNLPSNKLISLHSIDSDVPYRCVAQQLPCDFSKKNDKCLYENPHVRTYKIFAEKDLNDSNFEKIFSPGYKLIQSVPWLAYPKYNVNPNSKTIPSVILDSNERSRVFYLNSLEWSSSCMEICVISARNVVNLIANKENVKPKMFFNRSTNKKNDFILNNLSLICKISTIVLLSGFILSLFYKL